jgi:transposase
MAIRRSEEFRRDVVRIALTSGLTRRQASSDFGIGMSTLHKWIKTYRDMDVVSKEDQELAKENERLGRENRLLREERELLKFAG